jgi:hypothetical protein
MRKIATWIIIEQKWRIKSKGRITTDRAQQLQVLVIQRAAVRPRQNGGFEGK